MNSTVTSPRLPSTSGRGINTGLDSCSGLDLCAYRGTFLYSYTGLATLGLGNTQLARQRSQNVSPLVHRDLADDFVPGHLIYTTGALG